MSDNLQKYPDPKYDVFIAHNSLDGDQVDELVQQLESRGVRVCHPARDFLAGRRVIENMASGIAESRKTITYLTKNFLASERCKQERAMAEHKSIITKQPVIVGILVDIEKAKLPAWLLVTTYVENTSLHFFRSLLTALEVSCPEVREGKTYDDLLQENATLITENASLLDSKILLLNTMNTWEEKERSWLSEKQVLTSKVDQLEFEKQQLANKKNNTEQDKRRKGPPTEKQKQKSILQSENMEVDTSVPVHWEPIPAGKTWTLVFLTSYTEEWQEVKQRFRRTAGELDREIGWPGIVRIQNLSLYQAYQTKKFELSPDMREEYTLYYGTSGWEECQQIRERGFSGNNANNFNSAGICFTTTSKVAIQNSRRDYWDKYIIVAKVLPGRSCVQANMVTSGQGVPVGYDSVVDNVDNPSWVRIKDARQAYPEYVIPYYVD